MRGLVWPIEDVSSPWSALELTLPSQAPSHVASSRIVLGTSAGNWLLDDDLLIASATGMQMPRPEDASVREGVLRLACSFWPDAFAAALGGMPSPRPAGSDINQDDAPSTRAAVLTLIDRNGQRLPISLRASRQTLLACTRASGWRPIAPPFPLPKAVGAIVLQLGLWLDRARLPATQLARLRPGDALWLPSNGRSNSSPLCQLSVSRLIPLGQVEHVSRQFQGWGFGGGAPSNSHHASSPSTEPSNVDALTVDLDFIVGRVAKTVSELCDLAPGQVIPLEALTPAHVRIVAHGTELGSGQLVDVEGRLAVEICEWGNAR